MRRQVYFRKLPKRKQTDICQPSRNIRTINMGAQIEQRPWIPTVRRGTASAVSPSPGPATVKLPTLIGSKVPDSRKPAAPAYSFGHKPGRRHKATDPDPMLYDISGLGPKGKHFPPASSLVSRPKDLTKFQNPGPAEYDVQPGTKITAISTPKYTFGQKPPAAKFSLIPGPNIYKIPSILGSSKEGPIRSAPAYTLTGREKKSEIPRPVLPGPGYYETSVKPKPPIYSIRGKYTMPDDNNNKPGPNAYCPEKYIINKSVPAPSFGVLHTPFLGKPKTFLLTPNQTKCAMPHYIETKAYN